MFIFEREKESVHEHECGRETEREEDRGSEAGSLLSVQSPTWVLNPRTLRHDLRQSQMLDLATQAPLSTQLLSGEPRIQ